MTCPRRTAHRLYSAGPFSRLMQASRLHLIAAIGIDRFAVSDHRIVRSLAWDISSYTHYVWVAYFPSLPWARSALHCIYILDHRSVMRFQVCVSHVQPLIAITTSSTISGKQFISDSLLGELVVGLHDATYVVCYWHIALSRWLAPLCS